ncbi:helix-turn-helix transcriptional regulator [Kribbella sp. GL6]|uniref:helix-turn-helix transcriptional regulator n=1 Tax=Kribbella sp. GL6 TaxID=3419765 RepID=UPI003CFCCAF6
MRADTGRRADVLRVLRDADRPMDIPEIAERLGIHVNTARFHLDTLVGTGQAERTTAPHRRPGRPPLLFQAVRRMNPTGPRHYRVLAEILTTDLATTQATEAGYHWGRTQATPPSINPVGRLMGMLEGLGFSPEELPGDGVPRIGLRHCPFLELAEERSEVVCAIHLGLMQGAMESWESPLTVDTLQPFAQPDLCIAHLARK